MNTQRYGIILNVENYDECVVFYRDVLELKLMFSKVDGDFKLTCLEFGYGYLMIETEGFAEPNGKSIKSCPSKLRFNVPDIEAACKRVKSLVYQLKLLKVNGVRQLISMIQMVIESVFVMRLVLNVKLRPNKLLKWKNNSWLSLRDFSQALFFAYIGLMYQFNKLTHWCYHERK